jgi:hypothetical protein
MSDDEDMYDSLTDSGSDLDMIDGTQDSESQCLDPHRFIHQRVMILAPPVLTLNFIVGLRLVPRGGWRHV